MSKTYIPKRSLWHFLNISYTCYRSQSLSCHLYSIIIPVFPFLKSSTKNNFKRCAKRWWYNMSTCPYKCLIGLGLFVHFHNGWMNRQYVKINEIIPQFNYKLIHFKYLSWKYYNARTQRHSFRGCGSFGIALRLQNNNIFSSMLVILLMISIKNWLSTKRRWK